MLYSLIFKRISNLYLIFKLNPDLIYELTYYYKGALHALRHSKPDHPDHAQLIKIVNICPNYVALVTEYFQVIKNISSQDMVDENTQKDP
jgi:hypothetical protein